ncbi:regulation of circadian rhythm and developmental growth [Cryphonectria parasitica EP155]|uniref:Regulation of circadian rhythm and developmental growth n=1 Tax=Cryphonectria parasitica (strain ATCC 38755 / EP155) TaxID=660469 RepID=A0A9P4XUM6_CRYP1|nr:regulation of circadian rhythm and developmental growth [Cryphonectria parasitica EP155]KAF3761126.1 regulation of circadian rhythm and developmental growth [Cryphonectria parasitica EP155]
MGDAASILLGFPPETSSPDEEFYDQAISLHIKKVDELLSSRKAAVQGDEAIRLLKLLNPAAHSISYLAILDSLSDYDGFPVEQRAQALIDFFLAFDPRQIRYIGSMFSEWLTRVSSESFPLPHDLKVSLLARAILKLDPANSMLTSHHLTLVNLAFDTDNPESAFYVTDRPVVYFPGMARDQNTSRPNRPLCDMTLPPTEYITEETGLTLKLDVERVLEYEFVSGLLYCSRGYWASAREAFERVITHPTRDGGVSKIMTDAYDKWLLTSLLANGAVPETPTHAGANAQKAYETLSQPYLAVVSCFEEMTAVELKEEIEKHAQIWRRDRNTGLMQEVLAAHQKWQIMDLRDVYSKISLSDIHEETCSAETGEALPDVEDVEALIQSMIQCGMLKGVIEKPDGKPPYLRFLPVSEDLSEAEYQRELASAVQRMKELKDIYTTTNARLSTDPNWIKHLIREQKREKEGANQGPTAGFEAQVEDEDLMSGVVSGSV